MTLVDVLKAFFSFHFKKRGEITRELVRLEKKLLITSVHVFNLQCVQNDSRKLAENFRPIDFNFRILCHAKLFISTMKNGNKFTLITSENGNRMVENCEAKSYEFNAVQYS